MPPKSERLNLAQKLAYGAGDFGPAVTANLLVFFWLPFLTDAAGLAAGAAGSILAISKVWDAVNDPIVGVLTDRTRSRWGRRRPWILLGAIPFGFTFFAQWLVPFAGNAGAAFWYYLAMALLFNSLYTAVNLPYTALTPELTDDYDERTGLSKFRFAFSIGGSLLSGVTFPLILAAFPNRPALGNALGAGIWAVLAVLPLFWCFFGTRERFATPPGERLPLARQLRIALANRPYLDVVGIYLCSWFAVQLIATVVPYYVRYWMNLPDSWLAGTIFAIQGTALAMLFVWSALSARLGKKQIFYLGTGFFLLAMLGLMLLSPGQAVWMLVLAVVAGVGVSTVYLIPWSMLPDVIDLDELQTGERREGVFYALLVLLQKVCLAASLLLVGQLLEAAGFDGKAAVQPDSALVVLRLVIGPIPAAAAALGLWFAWRYPITRERHRQILEALAARRPAA
ncbi:MAG: MFS transporter [Aphanocapsa lilacina HA4352-LM1]|nr:MFS transporter [Aphanocapsa lilacina HA4352-LM1]